MKKCTNCREVKPLTEYFVTKQRGQPILGWRCKPCTRLQWESIGNRYSQLINTAIARGIKADITRAEYAKLMKLPCTYCDGPLPRMGRGLDRIVPTGPYSMSNVVPCCAVCNDVKGIIYTYAEMKIIGPTLRLVREMRESAGLPPPQSRAQQRTAIRARMKAESGDIEPAELIELPDNWEELCENQEAFSFL